MVHVVHNGTKGLRDTALPPLDGYNVPLGVWLAEPERCGAFIVVVVAVVVVHMCSG